VLDRLYLVPYHAMRMFGLQHRLWSNSLSFAENKKLFDIDDDVRPYYVVYSSQDPYVFSFSIPDVPGAVTVAKRYNPMTFSALHNMAVWTIEGFEEMMRKSIGKDFALPDTSYGLWKDPMPLSHMPIRWVRSVGSSIFRLAPDMYRIPTEVGSEPLIPAPLCRYPNTIYESVLYSARLRDIFMRLRVSHVTFPFRYHCDDDL
jgi:hypothetical protein